MSYWTYINGVITVSPMGRTQQEKKYILDTVLEHLPIVSGSEKDMNIYTIEKKGCRISCSHDEFGERTNNLLDDYGDRSRRRGSLKLQDEYLIIVEASLRDRLFKETYKEFQKWLCRLAKRVQVEDVLVEVRGYSKSSIIRNPRIQNSAIFDTVYGQMFENPTWVQSEKESKEPNWCEYLMWDRAINGDMPMLLEYKYYANKENDKEAERRLRKMLE